MYMVIAPEAGGERLFASTVTAFERLSPENQQMLLQLDTENALGSEVLHCFDVNRIAVLLFNIKKTGSVTISCCCSWTPRTRWAAR